MGSHHMPGSGTPGHHPFGCLRSQAWPPMKLGLSFLGRKCAVGLAGLAVASSGEFEAPSLGSYLAFLHIPMSILGQRRALSRAGLSQNSSVSTPNWDELASRSSGEERGGSATRAIASATRAKAMPGARRSASSKPKPGCSVQRRLR